MIATHSLHTSLNTLSTVGHFTLFFLNLQLITGSTYQSFIFVQMGMRVGGGRIAVLQERFCGAKLKSELRVRDSGAEATSQSRLAFYENGGASNQDLLGAWRQFVRLFETVQTSQFLYTLRISWHNGGYELIARILIF